LGSVGGIYDLLAGAAMALLVGLYNFRSTIVSINAVYKIKNGKEKTTIC